MNSFSFARGFSQIEGEVLLKGWKINPGQMETLDGIPVPSDSSISNVSQHLLYSLSVGMRFLYAETVRLNLNQTYLK